MSERAVIVALGANTPLGADAWSSAAAVRAGISGFSQHPYMIDTAGEPMRVAYVPSIDIAVTGVDRFEALLFPAIDEVLQTIEPNASPAKTAIALALPQPRPGRPDALEHQLGKRIAARYGRLFGTAAAFSAGHAGGLIALQAACVKLYQGALDACVVAGVDSYLAGETLKWLESCDQLHGAGSLNNAWGFIPGEAGAAILVMRKSAAERRRLPALGLVLGVGAAHEPKRIKTEAVCLGEGLTHAVRSALTALPADSKVSDVYCDLNGEPYRADEYGFAILRTKEAFVSASEFVAPADCWGDVGAAGAPLHAQIACIAGQKGYASGGLALACSSAEGGERAAGLFGTVSKH